MHLSRLLSLLQKNRWTSIILPITIFLFITYIFQNIFTRTISNTWPERQHEIDSTLAQSIKNKFQSFLEIPCNASHFIMNDSTVLHGLDSDKKNVESKAKIFERFQQAYSLNGLSIALYDSTQQLIAYHNREIPLDSADLYQRHTSTAIKIIRGPLYTHVVVMSPCITPKQKYFLLVTAVPLEITFPLHNRFLQSRGFRTQIRNELGIELIFDFVQTNNLRNDGRYVQLELRTPTDEILGTAYFLKTHQALHLQFIQLTFGQIEAFLFLMGAILFSIRFITWYLSRGRSAVLKIMITTVYLWIIRFGLLGLDIATKLFPEELLNPVHFASPFGFGAVQSLAELIISTICLFINLVLVWKIVSDGFHIREKTENRRTYVYAFLFVLLVPAVPLLIRGYGATIQSIVFDSSYNFDDVSSIFHQPFLWLMLCCICTITVSFVLGFISITLSAKRILEFVFDNAWKRMLYVTALSIGVYLLFGLVTNEFIYPFSVYVSGGIAFIALTTISKLQINFYSRASIIFSTSVLTVLSLAIFIPSLQIATNQKRMETVAFMSSDYTQSVDGWSTLLISQTLARINTDDLITDELSEEGTEDVPEFAFQVWARSPLSNEPNNSSVCIYDQHGHMRSLFSIGISQATARQDGLMSRLLKVDTSLIFHSPSLELKKVNQIYVGTTTIRNSDGEKIGTVVVTLNASERMQLTANRTDILRNTSEQKRIVPEDDFIISQFQNDTLSISTNPLVSKTIILPDSIRQYLHNKTDGNIWGSLHLGNAILKTFFSTGKDTNQSAVIAVSIPQAESRFILYRIFRFGLIFYLCFIVLFSIVFIERIISFIHHPRISFAAKLRVSFIMVAVIPIILFWGSAKQFSKEQTDDILKQQVFDGLNLIEANILQNVHGSLTKENLRPQITNQFCSDIAAFTGDEINFYLGSALSASSKPELYFTNLLNPQLNEEAFAEIVLREKDFFVAVETIGEFSYLVGYKPIRDDDGRVVAVISTPTLFEQNLVEQEYVRSSANIFMWSFVILLLILAVSVVLSNQIAKPVHELTAATKDIALGDLSRKIPVKRNDEIGDLITSFNFMTDKLAESQKDLAKAERELAWKEMAKQVAHEIRNPLTPMKLAAQHLLKAYKDGASQIGKLIEQVTTTIIEQVDALARISTEFSHFARMPERIIMQVDLNRLLTEIVKMFSHHTNITIQTHLSDDIPPIQADRAEMQRCFINIFRNAVQSIRDNGTISVESSLDQNRIIIRIKDSGIGMPPEILQRIFEPNFSTKTEGMGLGLSIVNKILDDQHASIDISSTLNEGTTVTVEFPVSNESEIVLKR